MRRRAWAVFVPSPLSLIGGIYILRKGWKLPSVIIATSAEKFLRLRSTDTMKLIATDVFINSA